MACRGTSRRIPQFESTRPQSKYISKVLAQVNTEPREGPLSPNVAIGFPLQGRATKVCLRSKVLEGMHRERGNICSTWLQVPGHLARRRLLY